MIMKNLFQEVLSPTGSNTKHQMIMKKLFYMITVAAFMASIASCGKLEQENTPSDGPVVEAPSADGTTTLTIAAGLPQTKTYWYTGSELGEGVPGEVRWSSTDVITVLGVGASAKSSKSSGAKAVENFEVQGWPADVTPLYAVFTAQDNNAYETYKPSLNSDGEVKVALKTNQEIFNKGSFGKVSNVSIGELKEGENGVYTTTMKNICGLIKLSLTSNAKSVTIEALDGTTPLAGSANIVMENGIPSVSKSITPSTSVTLTSRVSGEDETMQAGNTYMACVYPGTFIPKITIKATADDPNPIVIVGKSAVTITRNEIMDFGTLDNTPVTPPTPEEPEEPEQPEIPETLELTLDFASWPFSSAITANKNSTETLECTFNDYPFVISNSEGGGWQYRTAVKALQGNGTSAGNFSLTLPAIENRRLYSVEVTLGNTSGKYVAINSDANGPGLMAEVNSLTADLCPYVLGGENWKKVPEVNTSYSITSGGKTVQFKKIVITYKYVEPTSAE